MKVLFTSAIDTVSINENKFKPLWPAYLTAYAEEKLGEGCAEFVYDSGFIEEILDRHTPDILAISSVTQNFCFAEHYAKEAQKRCIPVIIGGMHISSLPSALTEAMNVGVIGEGEYSFTDLLALFIKNGTFLPEDLKKIKGIVFYKDGKLIETPMQAERLAIDEFPHPKRSLIGYSRRGHVYTARGCPYNCVFCACTRFWGKVRYASPEYILEEIQELIEHGAKVIRFCDENFVVNTKRLFEIAGLIRKAGFHKKIKFSCWARADNVTPEVVHALKSMNVVSIKMGLESGSDRVLDYLKGGVTVEQNKKAIELFKNAGIQTNADFIFGAPDETPEEIEKTYQFIKSSRIDMFDVDIFSPLPGTPVWELAKEKGLVSDKMDWSRLNYKFNRNPDTAIHLSEKLTHSELLKFYTRFQKLRRRRNFKAILRSPWLDEAPGIIIRFIIRKISALFRSYNYQKKEFSESGNTGQYNVSAFLPRTVMPNFMKKRAEQFRKAENK